MRRGSWKIRIFIGLAIVAFALIQRCNNKEENPYTGRVQNINMTAEQEIAIGLQSAPQMAQQHGGLYPDQRLQSIVDYVGKKLVEQSIARETPYKYEFHLLADERSINAFALPGGQIFITYALFSKLNESQLAGVLGHEIGHVTGRLPRVRVAVRAVAAGRRALQRDDLVVPQPVAQLEQPETAPQEGEASESEKGYRRGKFESFAVGFHA